MRKQDFARSVQCRDLKRDMNRAHSSIETWQPRLGNRDFDIKTWRNDFIEPAFSFKSARSRRLLRQFESIRQQAWAPAMGPSDDPQAVLLEGGGCYQALGEGKWHWHDCITILLPHIGAFSLKHADNQAGTWISQDQFMVLPRDHAHASHRMRAAHSHTALHVTEDALHMLEADAGSLARFRQQTRKAALFPMTRQIRSIHAHCREFSRCNAFEARAQEHLGAALLINCLVQAEKSPPIAAATQHGHGAALVSDMKAFIADNCSKPVPLDEIAHDFGISRRHATRLFRRHAGGSISEFQQREQINRARSLLIETDLSVGEIAYRVGFQSGSALTRAMRRLDDMSPGEIRRMLARPLSSRIAT
jgi:AraC-like DNA-binding protein